MLDKTTLEEWKQEFGEQNTVNGSMDSAKGLLRARSYMAQTVLLRRDKNSAKQM